MVAQTFNLFSGQKEFEEAAELVEKLNARKRGSYNTKLKVVEYNPYTHIQKLYTQLGDLIGICLFSKDDIVWRYRGIKIWSSVYNMETYEYQGKEYIGEQFQINQAEIRGTESFTVNDRIKLHEKLIKLLKQRVELKYAIKLVQQDVKELQKKYTISEYAQWLRKQKINYKMKLL